MVVSGAFVGGDGVVVVEEWCFLVLKAVVCWLFVGFWCW